MKFVNFVLILCFQAFAGVTQMGFPCLLYKSRDPDKPNICYRFVKIQRKKPSDKECYRCSNCVQARKKGPNFQIHQRFVVNGNIFESDPDLGHSCTGEMLESVYGKDIYKDVADEIKNTGITRREILKVVEDACLSKYGPDLGKKIRGTMGFDPNLARSLQDYSRLDLPPGICEPGTIAEELQKSLSGDGNIVKVNEGGEKPFILLLEDGAKEILRKCRHLVLDGTFEKRPYKNGFAQMYNIIAVFPDLPNRNFTCLVGVALLPSKDKPTYNKLFAALKNVLEDDLGEIKIVHTDQESAVMASIREMFPEWSLKLCNFHYHKNIRDYIHNKINANLLKNQEFVKWKAEIVGASFLPLNKQQEFINFQMQNLPEVPRNLVADVQTFKQYYMENWIPKLELINYYDFKGPRTTNSCEGFHSGLNTLIKENRPTFRSVYMAIREELKHSVMKYQPTMNGTLLPPRVKKYKDSEASIMVTMEDLKLKIEEGHADVEDNEWIACYCRRQSYNSAKFINEALDELVAEEEHIQPPPQPEPEAQPQQQIIPANVGPQNIIQPQPQHHHYHPYIRQRPQIRQQQNNFNASLPIYLNPAQPFYHRQPLLNPAQQLYHRQPLLNPAQQLYYQQPILNPAQQLYYQQLMNPRHQFYYHQRPPPPF